MKQIVKKTAGLFTILSIPFSVFGQQSVEFQRSAVGQMLDGSAVIAFLGSPEFKVAVILLGIITLAIWGVYFISLIRVNSQEAPPGSTIVGPLVSFPAELFSRGSLGTHHFGSIMPRLVPTDNAEETTDHHQKGRAKKHDHLQRGE